MWYIARAFADVSLTPHYSASTEKHARNSHAFLMMPFNFKFIRQVSEYTNEISERFSERVLHDTRLIGPETMKGFLYLKL